MKYVEYGKEHAEVMIFLHGGGLSWWNYREAAQKLSQTYRVILPVLDGHAGSTTDFTTVEANADRLIRWIDERFGGSVLLLGGLSLGGQVLLEILSRRRDICRYALVESALVIPSRLTHALIGPAFGSCHGLIRRRWFARWQFRALRMKPPLFEDYFRDSCAISKQNMIAFLKANARYEIKASAAACGAKTAVFVGGKENGAMRKSAAIIHCTLPGSVMKVLPGLRHGEFSLNHADAYADAVLKLVGGRKNEPEQND